MVFPLPRSQKRKLVPFWFHFPCRAYVPFIWMLGRLFFSYLTFGMLLGYSWWILFSSVLTKLQEAIFIMCPFSSSGIFIIHMLSFLNMFTMSHMFSFTIFISISFFLCALKYFLYLTIQATNLGLNNDLPLCDFSLNLLVERFFFFSVPGRLFGSCCCCCCLHLDLLEYSLFLYLRWWCSSLAALCSVSSDG